MDLKVDLALEKRTHRPHPRACMLSLIECFDRHLIVLVFSFSFPCSPLGPFVPAPPEMAMRMMRDQGSGPIYEGNSGPRGRKGRLGPPIGASAPLLAVPPAFQHDPRRIRSYQDLDAPEDEVTVIDYRSL